MEIPADSDLTLDGFRSDVRCVAEAKRTDNEAGTYFRRYES